MSKGPLKEILRLPLGRITPTIEDAKQFYGSKLLLEDLPSCLSGAFDISKKLSSSEQSEYLSIIESLLDEWKSIFCPNEDQSKLKKRHIMDRLLFEKNEKKLVSLWCDVLFKTTFTKTDFNSESILDDLHNKITDLTKAIVSSLKKKNNDLIRLVLMNVPLDIENIYWKDDDDGGYIIHHDLYCLSLHVCNRRKDFSTPNFVLKLMKEHKVEERHNLTAGLY